MENEERASTILFVYGSLKRGHVNHRHLASQQFLREAVTEPRYRLVDLGKYPGLIHNESGLAIRGELWSVWPEALRALDRFEGAYYERAPIAIAGLEEPAETYFWIGPVQVLETADEWPFD